MDSLRNLSSCLPCFPAKENESDAGKPPKTVNIFLGFFFMVNFVLGTGFLSIPYAFYHTGIVAGAVTLVVISFISWNCAVWELEVMARAQVSASLKFIVYSYLWECLSPLLFII